MLDPGSERLSGRSGRFVLSLSAAVLDAARQLSRAVSGLSFPDPVTHVYNPLDYAWEPHREYLRRFAGTRKRVLLLGMNPGPWGMVQTGVPFGEVAAVRDWLGISSPIGAPRRQHSKRPVTGLSCTRSEVSGRRLWGLFAERFGSAEAFFADHMVTNYCPLAFMEESGRNHTPDKMPAAATAELFAACDRHLERIVELLEPQWLIGVGGFAEKKLQSVFAGSDYRVGRVLHPSPASPAANKGWAEAAVAQLESQGVWS